IFLYSHSSAAVKQPSHSSIQEIHSVAEISHVFELSGENDLWVFDIDQVLLKSSDPLIFADQEGFYNNEALEELWGSLFQSKSPQERKTLISKIRLNEKKIPVEQSLIDKIIALQKRNIKVIALSAFMPGKYGPIARTEVCKYEQLMKLGLNFESSFEQKDVVVKFKSDTEKPVIFYKGILCSGDYEKGFILTTFLKYVGFRPSRIYFVDDRFQNVESVVQGVQVLQIPCQGYFYRAATINRSINELDLEVVKFQIELMIQCNNYVSYFEAKNLWELQKIVK
ncbi:MAG: hypothetical protein US22_C0032G0009, partial [candidate division TM6 bacterium GW2011_GWF2_36_6]